MNFASFRHRISMKRILLRALVLTFVAFAAFAVSRAAVAAAPEQSQWHVLIEPKFMRPPVSSPIPGAERTVLAAGYLAGDEVRYFTKAEFDALGLDWAAFQTKAAANVSEKKLKAEFVRNRKNIVEYASLTSDNPFTATAVLSPDFLKKFEEFFGSKLLVAIPNRYTIYVFPSLASNYKDYAPMIIEAYHATAYPVSLEVFAVSKDGMRAVGMFEE